MPHTGGSKGLWLAKSCPFPPLPFPSNLESNPSCLGKRILPCSTCLVCSLAPGRVCSGILSVKAKKLVCGTKK